MRLSTTFFGHRFSGKYDFVPKSILLVNIFSPRIDISNDVSCASNGDSMPKLRPREVETPTYPSGAHSFGASSPRVRLLEV